MPDNMELGARVSDGWSPGRRLRWRRKRFTQKPTEDPMTDERMALVELLQKSGDGDFLRGDRMPPPRRDFVVTGERR
jgi:hypothetical protein